MQTTKDATKLKLKKEPMQSPSEVWNTSVMAAAAHGNCRAVKEKLFLIGLIVRANY